MLLTNYVTKTRKVEFNNDVLAALALSDYRPHKTNARIYVSRVFCLHLICDYITTKCDV